MTFPRFEDVIYASSFLEQWEALRLVCTQKHFDTYFRMTVGDETLPINEIDAFINQCGDKTYVKVAFREALRSVRKNGRSKVPLLLEELNTHASKIEKAKFEPLISAIFEIADEIDRDADRERGFSFGDNYLRIHWLIRKLTFERCDLNERSEIFGAACKEAQVGWLVDFTTSAIRDYYPRKGDPEPPEKCLIKKEYLDELKPHAIKAIGAAAASGKLVSHSRLAYILFRWRELVGDDGAAVKAWANSHLADDLAVALFAKAFTSESWSQSMEDRIAIRQTTAAVSGLSSIIDVDAFRSQLDRLDASGTLDAPYKGYVHAFIDAWRKRENGEER